MKKSIKRMQSSLLGLLSVRFLSNQKILILLSAMLAAISAHAYDFEYTYNGKTLYYNITSNNTCEVTYDVNEYGYIRDGYVSGEVHIPSEVDFNGTIYKVTSIGYAAFYECHNIISINIPSSVSSIGGAAFYCCYNLTSINIPSSVTSIGGAAFYVCESLTSIEIPSSITSIDRYTFFECNSLTSIEIPSSITSIGEYAFGRCYSLNSIEIPSSIISIGNCAFNECGNLSEIYAHNSNPSDVSLGEAVFYGVKVSSCILYVPKGSRRSYGDATQWGDFSNIICKGNEIEGNQISLNDGEEYTIEGNYNHIDVTYTRTFNNTNWQALYLPFDMRYDEWSTYADIAELYNVHGYDRDQNGTIDEVRIEFNRLKEGSSIKPNVPYVIRAKETGKVNFSCIDKNLFASPVREGMVECSSTKYTYAFYGIYEEKTDVYSSGVYFLAGGKFCQAADATVTLSPYRAYLTVTPKTGNYNGDTTSAKAPQRIVLVVDGEEQTAGIDDIMIGIPMDDVYYDLMGRKTTNPTSGIYIQNGRKVYIK